MWMSCHYAMAEHIFFKHTFSLYDFLMFQTILCNSYNNCKWFVFIIIIICVCVHVYECTCHGVLVEVREQLSRVGCSLASQEPLVLNSDHQPWQPAPLLAEPSHPPLKWSWFSVHSWRGIFMNVSNSSSCKLCNLASTKPCKSWLLLFLGKWSCKNHRHRYRKIGSQELNSSYHWGSHGGQVPG